MILSLYLTLIGIALILIIIGLFKPQESAMALVGFTFLFFLSFTLMLGNLEYEVGANINTSLTYNVDGKVTNTDQTVNYEYESFNAGNSRQMGFYLIIVSVVGFTSVIMALKNDNWGKKEEGD